MSEEIKGTLTARSVDLSHYGKEPTFGPSSCSACGKFYTLGPHVCNPTYKELEAELATAREKNKRLREALEEIEAVACGETQIESDGAYDDGDGLHWIYKRIQALPEGGE